MSIASNRSALKCIKQTAQMSYALELLQLTTVLLAQSTNHSCRSRHCLRVEGCFARISPNFPKKHLWDKFSPYRSSVPVATLYFPLPYCQRRENIKFGSWSFVITV